MEPTRKLKPKKCIAMLDCLKQSISSDKESVGNMYNKIVELMKLKNPEFVARPLEDDVPHGPWPDPIQRVDQEIQVSMDESNKGAEEIQGSPVTNGTVPCYKNGSSRSPPDKRPSNRNNVVKSKRRSFFDPNVVVKVEDSGSDDSGHSEEIKKTEHLVHRMMAPCATSGNSASPKSLLHYVVIENLPLRTTSDEVVYELLVGILGITREEVTGITVHAGKTESVAQIYFKDLKHVQQILVFSGKLVFKGRVITSRIGSP